jgi:hypothetical protein
VDLQVEAEADCTLAIRGIQEELLLILLRVLDKDSIIALQ